MSLKTRSAGGLWLDDFALIFVTYGHCDETKILPCQNPYSVSKALTADRSCVVKDRVSAFGQMTGSLALGQGGADDTCCQPKPNL